MSHWLGAVTVYLPLCAVSETNHASPITIHVSGVLSHNALRAHTLAHPCQVVTIKLDGRISGMITSTELLTELDFLKFSAKEEIITLTLFIAKVLTLWIPTNLVPNRSLIIRAHKSV